MQELHFSINNGRELDFTQYSYDGSVFVSAHDGLTCEYEIEITPGDFIMLWNYYQYVKSNDIKCDFINPNGKN